ARNCRSCRSFRPQSRRPHGWPRLQEPDRHASRPARVPGLQGAEGAGWLMATFLGAHGYTPGPTQRPLLAGIMTGVVATVPAIAILYLFPSLRVEARILRLTEAMTVSAGCAAMAAAGAVYGRVFGRAANDRRGGWLFGMAFGFALWAAGATMTLPFASGGTVTAGKAAIGVFLAFIAWGAALGALYPHVHRRLHVSLESASKKAEVGPRAATAGRRPDERQVRLRQPSPEDRRRP